MEETQKIKGFDQELKKFVEKNIHQKQLIKCKTLMNLQKLKLFYQTMQAQSYNGNVKKLKKQRIFSQPSEFILNLRNKKGLIIDFRPSFTKSKAQKIRNKIEDIKIQAKQNRKFEKSQQFFVSKQSQQIFQSQINYFVRNRKGSKVERYINVKPQLNQDKDRFSGAQSTFQIRQDRKLLLKKYMNRTSYKQRLQIIQNIKKSSHRHSCYEL